MQHSSLQGRIHGVSLAACPGDSIYETLLRDRRLGCIDISAEDVYCCSYESYLFAVTEAMRTECRAVVDSGFILQLDSPDLPELRRVMVAHGDPVVVDNPSSYVRTVASRL